MCSVGRCSGREPFSHGGERVNKTEHRAKETHCGGGDEARCVAGNMLLYGALGRTAEVTR